MSFKPSIKLCFPSFVEHSDLAINSVDAQPNGYRLLTGGADNKIKVWNLLPILSDQHEVPEEERAYPPQPPGVPPSTAPSTSSQNHPQLKARHPQSPYAAYLESLFEDEDFKRRKLLASLEHHGQPVNCVRWNRVGSLFASSGDDYTIIVWQFQGLANRGFG